MERSDWSRVAHAGMELMNPLPAAKLGEAIEALGSIDGSKAIDLGCGKGALLERLRSSNVRWFRILPETNARANGSAWAVSAATANCRIRV